MGRKCEVVHDCWCCWSCGGTLKVQAVWVVVIHNGGSQEDLALVMCVGSEKERERAFVPKASIISTISTHSTPCLMHRHDAAGIC